MRTGTNLTMTVGGDRTTTPQPIGGSSLDLTSLGSPANTSLDGHSAAWRSARVPVTNGTANVNLPVPATVPSGLQDLDAHGDAVGHHGHRPGHRRPGAHRRSQPTRLFDTRPGAEPGRDPDGAEGQGRRRHELSVKATDIPGLVPATGVGAVSLNVAVTNPEAAGFVTVYDCGNRQLVASVNYVAGETVSNAVIAPVSATGDGVLLQPRADRPRRRRQRLAGHRVGLHRRRRRTALFDTRPARARTRSVDVAKGKIGGAGQLLVDVTPTRTSGTPSTVVVPPSGVGAVSLNVAVADPDAGGFVTVYDCGTRQLVASVNYVAGEVASNAVIAPVSAGGNVCFYSLSPHAHHRRHQRLVRQRRARTWPSGPNRMFDTRGAAESPDALVTVPTAKVGPANVLAVDVAVAAGEVTPGSNLGAISINIAATGSTTAGFVTVYAVRRGAAVRGEPELPGGPDHLQRGDRSGRRATERSASRLERRQPRRRHQRLPPRVVDARGRAAPTT